MKSSLSKCMLALAALLVCLMMLTGAAMAEGPSVSINAQITLEGTLPEKPETFTLRMKANDSGNPMPGGKTGGTCDLPIISADRGTFPAMKFDRVGIYTYTITQQPGTNVDCSYDGKKYDLTVSVINAENDGLEAVVALRQAGVQDHKEDTAAFHNVYKTIVKPTTPPGTITPTGVSDTWTYYLGGAVLLLIAASVIIHFLRRQGDGTANGK